MGLGSTAGPFPTVVCAGRLRLVLECEEHGGSRCWLTGWSTTGQWPSAKDALLLPFYPASRSGLQNPSREASALEVGLDRLETKERGEVLACLPCPPNQHPQPQVSAMSLLSSWMWSVLFSLNMGPPCLMMSSVATLVKASSTLLESLAEVSMAQRMS